MAYIENCKKLWSDSCKSTIGIIVEFALPLVLFVFHLIIALILWSIFS
ncbi:hypothetical protein HY745_07015 [Candidatus Desantisbacteria bacterium]|nr:hypothetical protein [Candidatus Desantisbacteria bacterium]